MTYKTCQESLRVLERGLELVRQGWTKKAFARTDCGETCSATFTGATSWCAVGAMRRAALDLDTQYWDASIEMERSLPARSRGFLDPVVKWNDRPRRTKEQVVALYETTIERLRGTLKSLAEKSP